MYSVVAVKQIIYIYIYVTPTSEDIKKQDDDDVNELTIQLLSMSMNNRG